MPDTTSPQERALDVLASSPEDVLQDPSHLAALGDPGQWAGDVEVALSRLPRRLSDAIRRAARSVLRAGRAAVQASPQGAQGRVGQDAPTLPEVLMSGAKCFVRRGDRYRLVDRAIVPTELAREGLRVTTTTSDGGSRPMSFAELYSAYGDRVDEVVYRLGAVSDTFVGGVLTIGCGAVDPSLTPRYDPQVDEWLDVLAGVQADRLRDWLASVTDLEHPTAALYLRAPAGAGKSMLATGIQRVFGPGVADYDDVVLGAYSGALLRQPIVWLDERAGEDKHGRGSAGFRALTANSRHRLTEKYLAAGTLVGCPRLVVTSNDDDALRFGREDLARTDEEAIGIRILHLVASSETAAYLEACGGRPYTDDWVSLPDGSAGRIARHILWLRDNWQVTRPGSRLLVEGEVGAWIRGQASRSGLSQEILVAIGRYLVEYRHHADVPRVAAVDNGEVVVYTSELCQAWGKLTGDQRSMTSARLGRAIGRFAAPHRGAKRGHRVTLEQLVDAADEVGVGDVEQLRALVGRPR